MFNRSNNNDSITRSEAKAYVDGLEQQLTTAEAAVRRELSNLNDRVTTLETLAARMRAGLPVRTPGASGAPTVPAYDRSGLPEERQERSALDYGAVAFGLAEIKRAFAAHISGGPEIHDPISHYHGAVQYFADVFAKADPAFNEADFKRQAGV